MKILFIINSRFLSGAEISALHLIQSLNSQQYGIFLALPHRHKFPVKDLKFIHVIELPMAWFSISYNPLTLLQYCFNLFYCSFQIYRFVKANTIDILYSNSDKSQVYGLVVKAFSKKKSIWHMRDNNKLTWMKRLLTRYSDKIICVSRFTDQQIDGKYLNKLLIYNGVDTRFYLASPNIKLSEGDFKSVTMVSQITHWKNIEDFITVAMLVRESIPNTRFMIAGDCLTKKDTQYKKKILQMIRQAKLTNHIKWLGWVNDIRETYQQTDVLIHTAINEPFGRTVAEAMAMEIPVIAYDCGGPREVIVDGITGYLIPPRNYQVMAEKLILLLNNPETRHTFGRNGRNRIMTKFSLNTHTKLIEKVFDGLYD